MAQYFVRARPHVDLGLLSAFRAADAGSLSEFEERDPSELFFDSGRSALRWLLHGLRIDAGGTRLRVGVQAFTCDVVVKAIVESGNQAVLLDTDLRSFSTSLETVGSSVIDVLILTHLFGVPNPELGAIASDCAARGIILIEDVAQTVGATASGLIAGTVGEFSIYSFGLDKPISAYSGGMLRVGASMETSRWRERYRRLPEESDTRAKRDLLKLKLYWNATDPLSYTRTRRFSTLGLALASRFGQVDSDSTQIEARVRTLPLCGFADTVINVFEGRRPIVPRRLARRKVAYIEALRTTLPEVSESRRLAATSAIQVLRSAIPSLEWFSPENGTLAPCRLAVLVAADCRSKAIRHLDELGIEAGPFNWPRLAASHGRWGSRVEVTGRLVSSDELVQRVLNLPIWSPEIWNTVEERLPN